MFIRMDSSFAQPESSATGRRAVSRSHKPTFGVRSMTRSATITRGASPSAHLALHWSSTMRSETLFVTDGELIIVKASVLGPMKLTSGRFVLDTGAAMTTVTHEFVESLGYGVHNGTRRTRVRTAIGMEEGYILPLTEFSVLRFTRTNFRVNVFDLGYEDLDGLIGMNFLNKLNYEIRSAEKRIFAGPI